MGKDEITKIFWDWDGVLGLQKFWYRSTERDEGLRSFADRLFADKELLRSWMRGQVTLAEMCERNDSPYDPDTLTDMLIRDWRQGDAVHTALFAKLAQAYPHAQHYISTDNMDIFNAFANESKFIRDNFEKVYNSANCGVLKDDRPGLYEYILADLSLTDFSNALVLDDSATNCKRFCELDGAAKLMERGEMAVTDFSISRV